MEQDNEADVQKEEDDTQEDEMSEEKVSIVFGLRFIAYNQYASNLDGHLVIGPGSFAMQD